LKGKASILLHWKEQYFGLERIEEMSKWGQFRYTRPRSIRKQRISGNPLIESPSNWIVDGSVDRVKMKRHSLSFTFTSTKRMYLFHRIIENRERLYDGDHLHPHLNE
jgi:hypothetical protein